MMALKHRALMKVLLLLVLMISFLMGDREPACAGVKETLTVGVRTNVPPFCFISRDKGRVALRGMQVDILRLAAHHIGVDLKFFKCASIGMARQLLREGKIDFIGIGAQKRGLSEMSETNFVPLGIYINGWLFVHSACNTIVCARDLPHKKVAMIEGTNDHENYRTDEDFDFCYLQSPLEALKMVNAGLADAFIAPSELVARYLIKQEGLAHVRRVGLKLSSLEMGWKFRKEDTRL
jgi:ABC-type amino acid transport substrate-binding protein